jgi:hypothetical protein
MITIETMREFFGWCLVINIGFLSLSTVLIVAIRGTAVRIHGKMFNLDEQSLSKAYLQYLSQYKVVTLAFSAVPYIALRIMS